ncbi:MAG: uroporphyrinogen decarboxylase family protein [Actinomycetota bacterium]
MSSKQLFRDSLAGADGGAVAPLVFTYASRIRGLKVREMMSDPTLLANALADALELFDYDAVLASFDLTLEAEALGCEVEWNGSGPAVSGNLPAAKDLPDAAGIQEKGRLPVAVEVIRRLVAVHGRDRAVMAAITGPLTLFRHLDGRSLSEALAADEDRALDVLDVAGEVVTSMAQLYGDLGLDAVILAEEAVRSETETGLEEVMPVYGSLWDIARYFNQASVFLPGGYAPEQVAGPICTAGADCVMLWDAEGLEAAREAAGPGLALGGGVPPGALSADPGEIFGMVERCVKGAGPSGYFVSTGWEVPLGANLESLHAMVAATRQSR